MRCLNSPLGLKVEKMWRFRQQQLHLGITMPPRDCLSLANKCLRKICPSHQNYGYSTSKRQTLSFIFRTLTMCIYDNVSDLPWSTFSLNVNLCDISCVFQCNGSVVSSAHHVTIECAACLAMFLWNSPFYVGRQWYLLICQNAWSVHWWRSNPSNSFSLVWFNFNPSMDK